MRDADFDRILSKEDEILPSSGFSASVMETVQREAAAPPPIPFPWKRALPGLCAAGVALVSVLVASILLLARGAATQPVPEQWRFALASIAEASKNSGATWIMFALLLSFASVKLSLHFASAQANRSERV